MTDTKSNQKSKSVHFNGVIGKIRFDTTKGGVAKLTLHIAEHPNVNDPSETTWHRNVVATRDLAVSLNSLSPPLSVGEEIEIKVGYVFSWPYTDGSGRKRVNEGVNIWIIKVRGQTFVAKRKKEGASGRENQGDQTEAVSSDMES